MENTVNTHLPIDKPIYVDQINELTNKIVDDCMKDLLKMKKPFKYSVTVFIQQKNGCGVNVGSTYIMDLFLGAQFAEDSSDGGQTLVVHDHPHVDAIISIYGFRHQQNK
jgi:hypothetical protein